MGYIGNQAVQGYSSIPAKQDLTGATGGTLTLTHAVSSPEAIDLYINNVRQEPTESYSVAGTTVTLNGYTVAATDDIYVVYNALALQTSVPPDGSVTMAKLATSGTLPALDGSALTGLAVSNRNLIINGAMQMAQRSTSTASITTSAYYTVDRWFTALTTLGTWTQSQSTDVPSGQGFASSLKMACTTADASPAAGDRLIIRQVLEGQDVQQLKKGTANAESVTLSFWVKSSKTGTHIVEIYDQDNARNIAKAYTVSSANTWEKKELTFAGDTTGAFDNDNASSFVLNMYLGAGSTYTSGTLATSWESATSANRAVGQVNLADSTSNEWYITGVQLEVGETATPFEHRSYGDELARCQRYYQTSFPDGNNIGTVNLTTTQTGALIHVDGSGYGPVSLPVTMRSVGSAVIYAPLANPTINLGRRHYDGAIHAVIATTVTTSTLAVAFATGTNTVYQCGYTLDSEL